MATRTINWIDLNRFDTKPDKSTWLEMGHELNRIGFQVQIITSFEQSPFEPNRHNVSIISIKAVRIAALFRISLLFKSVCFLIGKCDRNSIVIIPVAGLLAVPILRIFRFRNIHLDVRTVPVTVRGTKRRLDKLIFWDFALKYFAKPSLTYSFITERLKAEVEKVTRTSFHEACIWGSGVRGSLFRSTDDKSKDLDGAAPYNIFYHGTVMKDRGIFDVVEAIKMLHGRSGIDITLTVVGPGPDLTALSDWIRNEVCAKSVSIVGFVPYESVPDYIEKADCCICPLPPRPEWQVSSPLKLFEYMAMAKPIIATRIAAHWDVLQSQEFVVWSDNHDALNFANAIEFAYLNRHKLAAAAKNGPLLVSKHYDWSSIGQHFGRYLKDHYGQTS